ncbi:hypothetical protein BH09PSE5_BH09PSE5_33890 [soil metagenome]
MAIDGEMYARAVSSSEVSTMQPRPVRSRSRSAASTPRAVHMPVPKSSTDGPVREGGLPGAPFRWNSPTTACTIAS